MNELDILFDLDAVVILHLALARFPEDKTSLAMCRKDIRTYLESMEWFGLNRNKMAAAAAKAGFSLIWTRIPKKRFSLRFREAP